MKDQIVNLPFPLIYFELKTIETSGNLQKILNLQRYWKILTLNKYVVNRLILFPMRSINRREPATWLSFSDIEFISYSFQLLIWKIIFTIYIVPLKLSFSRTHKLLEICPFSNRLSLCPQLGTFGNGSSTFPWRSYPTCSWRQLEIRYSFSFSY